MTPAEAALLLAEISFYDGREVTEQTAIVWAKSLADVPIEDALEGLPAFYREARRDTRNWIYPGDVLAGAQRVQSKRRSAVYRAAYDRSLAENLACIDHAAGELTRERATYEAEDAARRTAAEVVDTYRVEHPQLEQPDTGFTNHGAGW